jgi:hypothetical protein
MPDRIEKPTIIASAGNLPKRIGEFVGWLGRGTGTGATVVLSGDLRARGGFERGVWKIPVTVWNLGLAPHVEKILPANFAFGTTC